MTIRVLHAIAFSLLCSFPVSGQGLMVKTNSDFDAPGNYLFLDSKSPSYSELDQEMVRITYKCTLAFEDRKRKPAEATYVLQIGRGLSKYYNLIQHKADSAMFNTGSACTSFRIGIYQEKVNQVLSQDCYYVDLATGELTFTGRLVTEDFRYKEQLPSIEWTIEDERQDICGYSCSKAVGQFRGKSYTVWFTEELPANAGPWKLRNLPGVILRVRAEDGACSMDAVSVASGLGKIIMADYPYIDVSRKQYTDMQYQFFEKPSIFISRHFSRIKATMVPNPKTKPYPPLDLLE